MRLTLRQLQYFEALARTQHFGRAAEACAVSQPALSVQIQELEAQLGARLVDRGRSGPQLTAVGLEIAGRARRILNEVRDLEETAREPGLGGVVRLGIIPTIAPYMLPGLLEGCRRELPELDLHIQESRTLRLVEALATGMLDVVLLALPLSEPGLTTLPLFEDRFLVAAPADLKLREPVAIPFPARNKLLLLEEGHCLRDQALSVCELAAADAMSALGASSLTTLIELVAAGHGLTLVPEMSVKSLQRDKRVKLLRMKAPEPTRLIGLAWRQSSGRADGFTRLGALIKGLRR